MNPNESIMEYANLQTNELTFEYCKFGIAADKSTQAIKELKAELIDANKKRYHPFIWFFAKRQYGL